MRLCRLKVDCLCYRPIIKLYFIDVVEASNSVQIYLNHAVELSATST